MSKVAYGWWVRLVCLLPVLAILGYLCVAIWFALDIPSSIFATAIVLLVGFAFARWTLALSTSTLDVFCISAGIVFLTALLWPATQPCRDPRMLCMNNLKQIALGLHKYRDVHKKLTPPYLTDSAGEPVHSWRVMLLPFVEEQELYDQYDMSSDWNSIENLKLVSSCPPVYRCSHASKESKGETQNFAIVGDETIWHADKPMDFTDVGDGTSNTLAFVESHGRGVKWTEPRDLRFEQMQWKINADPPGSGVSSPHPGAAIVALLDGSVRILSETIDKQTLKALTTANGGEAIDDAYY